MPSVVLSDTLKLSLPPVGKTSHLSYTCIHSPLSSSPALRCGTVEVLITRKSVADAV